VSIQDFDNLTAALADRAISRKRALQMAAASALGVAGLGLAAGEAQAAPNCPRRRTGCCRECRNTNKVCVCLRTNAGRNCFHQCCYPASEFTQTERFCGGDFGGCGDLPGDNRCVQNTCCGALPGNATGTCMRVCEGQGQGTECVRYPC
jgi:hypothetical protein